MLTLINQLGNRLRGRLGGTEVQERRILLFGQVERRENGLYYVLTEDTPYTGMIRRWRNKEEISDQMEFRYGALHGATISWYASGSILAHHRHSPINRRRKHEIHYVCGQKHGLETRWYFDGRPSHHGEYQLGLKHGIHLQWYHNGQKRSEMEYQEGLVCDGTWCRWHANGQIAYEDTYQDNFKLKRKVLSPDGQVILESVY